MLDTQEIAKTNPGFDAEKLRQFEEHKASLEKAGMLKRPHYQISAPLGGGNEQIGRPEPAVIRTTAL